MLNLRNKFRSLADFNTQSATRSIRRINKNLNKTAEPGTLKITWKIDLKILEVKLFVLVLRVTSIRRHNITLKPSKQDTHESMVQERRTILIILIPHM